MISPIIANIKSTVSIDAALRGNFTLYSKKLARGKSKMENRHENIKGESMSFAKTVT
jgi:hypothetical protein